MLRELEVEPPYPVKLPEVLLLVVDGEVVMPEDELLEEPEVEPP